LLALLLVVMRAVAGARLLMGPCSAPAGAGL